MDDDTFDARLSDAHRRVSGLFWTPLDVVRQSVAWLDAANVGDILDIGSGVGKWCVAAALYDTHRRRRYLGVEHRAELVHAARALANECGVADRVQFWHGEVADLLGLGTHDLTALVDTPAYFLFNPFGENVAPDAQHLDTTVELSEARYHRDVDHTETLFDITRPGAFALVYNGFGGRFGAGWLPVLSDFERPHVLRLWRKHGAPREGTADGSSPLSRARRP